MLDRASLERLARTPERNAPMLNVALAEQGTADVLLALARAHAVGPQAIEVVAERIEREGQDVGRDPDLKADDFVPIVADLDRLLVVHPSASSAVLASIVSRHNTDPFFVLAAACHPSAPLDAVVRAMDWLPASPMHDRLWLPLLNASALPPLALEEWAQDPNPIRREAIARISRDEAVLAALACDSSRQVRRAVASNRFASSCRATLAADDPAPEVRLRASGALTAHGELTGEGSTIVDTARFAAALRAMNTGGVLAPDVIRALSALAGPLDDEGALWASRVLPRKELGELVNQILSYDMHAPLALHLAAGIALRPRGELGRDNEDEGEWSELVYEVVKALSRTTTAETRLTGKARLAAWASQGIAHITCLEWAEMLDYLALHPIGADRLVLARGAMQSSSIVPELCKRLKGATAVPASLLELAWRDSAIDDTVVVDLASRIAKPKRRAEDLPEDEVDLNPALRSLDLLERVVLIATQRANVSPRAALTVVALDARRVRYVLSAMPQWKGRLTGGRLARVFRHHAGALTVAHAEARGRTARVEGWTQRMMNEIELAIALAVGHLTSAEIVRRIDGGRQAIEDGLTLVSGAETRAALEGPKEVLPILDWATKNRTTQSAALAIWLLLENLDRERAPTLIASSIDAIATGKGVVPASVCDALATLEHRQPGRLETIHAQSPRGRATLASAIARAYRAIGGMRGDQ